MLENPAPAGGLVVGHAENQAEADADRMADVALSRLRRLDAGAPADAAAADVQQHGAVRDHLRRSAVPAGDALVGYEGGVLDARTSSAIEGRRGSGKPLDAGLQRRMGDAFHTDFSGVRIHTDDSAARLNSAVSARAFTTGQDVFFGQGQFAPGTAGGDRVIAHELAHTLQRGAGAARSLGPSASGKGADHEAIMHRMMAAGGGAPAVAPVVNPAQAALTWVQTHGYPALGLGNIVNPALTTGNCHGFTLGAGGATFLWHDEIDVFLADWMAVGRPRVLLCLDAGQTRVAHSAISFNAGLTWQQTLPDGPVFGCNRQETVQGRPYVEFDLGIPAELAAVQNIVAAQHQAFFAIRAQLVAACAPAVAIAPAQRNEDAWYMANWHADALVAVYSAAEEATLSDRLNQTLTMVAAPVLPAPAAAPAPAPAAAPAPAPAPAPAAAPGPGNQG